MTKSPLMSVALVSAFAAAAAGCAHQPSAPASVSGELTVMQMANEEGYTTPMVVDGKTLYCQREELTGSLVPKTACVSSDEVVARARAQGDLLKYMASPPNAVQRPGG
ncbi:MAG TPA: hypothetical protein VHY36_14060 [Steroidobacteraceae bacterium]|jgi:hypothetical protein|nr:hypothetical protein [Steroidobacteraceae bacterium]